ncbi:PREDICTED: putative DBH-like monooxygenase protein 2 [Gekko japonicus]|uniref:DBH-like monooxygenase protein 2 n=1 Tax=Gekko japonicus TaxID=146911 RepID=A0ABM1L5X8_GEKJA|nr:PREDICTED: putative DBH-like monooxygenase protein 2 [Gekko japonicus]
MHCNILQMRGSCADCHIIIIIIKLFITLHKEEKNSLQAKAANSSHSSSRPLRFSAYLDAMQQVHLQWDHDSKEMITFELQVQSTGWVAFGFTTHGELPGGDVVIGGVLPDGNMYFSDWHIVDEETIVEDESQDYEVLSMTEDETSTTITFRRYFQTCDPHDQPITFPIPDDDTTYACTFIPLPRVKTKHHIYKFEAVITPRNQTMVHHILVYACSNASVLPTGVSDCYGADPDFALCSQIVVGWAVGGGSYMFPDETGISIGTPRDFQWIRLEVHYSNFDLIPGLIDNSGIRLYYTPELRPYDMGVLQTGLFTFPIHFLPPGVESFNSYGLCNTSQFEELNGIPVPDMHVFGYLLHTHLAGRGVRGVHYRDGKQLRILCEDNKYDFNLQETRGLKELVTFKAGDEFLVECRYETLDRTSLTFGGPSTLNEMCLAFLFYYPRNNISSCMGYPNIQYVAQELGQTAADAMEGMMAINLVDWNNDTAKKAEKACKEVDQIVIIKTIDEVVVNETGFIRDIIETQPLPCKRIFENEPTAETEGQGKFLADVMSSGALDMKATLPLPVLLFVHFGFPWLLTVMPRML